MTIARKFRSVTWTAVVASAALSCYLISHRVAIERNALAEVERDIQTARNDILSLNTEFQTRSRMSQIEMWNRRDLALGAPEVGQFIEGETALASLLGDPPSQAPVRQASASEEPNDTDRIDEDVFEQPAPDGLSGPHVQQAAYIVPDALATRPRGERISFLDDQFRGDIAGRAIAEQREEDSADQ